jgi:uncharacterized membrane protein SirB2
MSWFYSQMQDMHILLAWCSVALFLVRGLALQFKAEWPLDIRLRALVFGVNFLLVIAGLSLWGSLNYNPLVHTWLLAKFIAIAAYMACVHWAMGREEFSPLAYVAGLLLLAYVMAVATTREPLLGF